VAVAPHRSPQQEPRGDRRGDPSPRGPHGELRNKNQIVEDGILEWSRSEGPLSDRRIDLMHKRCDTHITVQPRNTHCNYFYTVATIKKNNATTKFHGNTYTIDKFQYNQGIPRFNISEVVRIMTFLRVHIMCPGFSTYA
jgi:hypothetical protein